MVSMGLRVGRDGLGALNQIYSVPLPEKCNDLITRGHILCTCKEVWCACLDNHYSFFSISQSMKAYNLVILLKRLKVLFSHS